MRLIVIAEPVEYLNVNKILYIIPLQARIVQGGAMRRCVDISWERCGEVKLYGGRRLDWRGGPTWEETSDCRQSSRIDKM